MWDRLVRSIYPGQSSKSDDIDEKFHKFPLFIGELAKEIADEAMEAW
jgi:hypothetical protein